MQIKELISYLETKAPLVYQESYDNAGLIIGNPSSEIEGVLITVDVTQAILEEAVTKKCNLIIAHHPMLFGTLKKINPSNATGRLIIFAIQHQIAIYALHTNLDNMINGVNGILAQKLGLINTRILDPVYGRLRKLVTFCPVEHSEKVRNALFEAGAGYIGNYSSCSFNQEGLGTFKAMDGANPFVGEKGELHTEAETRIEVIYPEYIEIKLIENLIQHHPYEEVAYDCYSLQNKSITIGGGLIGELPTAITDKEYLQIVKNMVNIPVIKHSALSGNKVKKIAICGGSGSFLLSKAQLLGADIFLTGDVKYHDFQQATERFIIADIGHYESEQFSKELIYSLICEKFSTFATLITEHTTNYVDYL